MINSFSDHVRRNQKQWMVVITILAVFSFVFDDLIRGSSNGGMTGGMTIFVAVFCGAAMSIIGYKRGMTVEFGLSGLVVGGLVALISLKSSGPPVVVRTKAGNFTQSDLISLKNQRQRADQFLRTVMKKIDKNRSWPGFGGYDDGSAVSFALLQKEARRMGVTVTDDSVNEFLSKVTENKLEAADYRAALLDTGIGEGQLFDIIRSELEVQLVAQLISAPAESHPTLGQFTRGQYSGRIARQTPEQLWQSYRKMHVKQGLSTVEVPVSEFVKLVPEPAESDLRQFFDKHKNGFGDGQGTPGFLEPPKVRLAYLAVTNLEAYEKQVGEITDQDVVDYYLANKESYRVNEIPAPSGPILPDMTPDSSSNDASPADATQTENGTDKPTAETDAVPELKKEGAPAEPANPDAKEESAKKEESAPCGDEPNAEKPVADKKDAEKKDAEETLPEPKGDATKADADSKSPPAPALPSNDTPADANAADGGKESAVPSLNTLPVPGAAPKYRELDDDLKEQIRETILRNRALQKMGETSDKALEMMMELSLEYSTIDSKKREEFAATFAAKLKSYAEENSLDYVETKEVSQFDLMNPSNDPIGNATDPVEGNKASRSQTSVAEEAFAQDASGRNSRLSIYSPRRADTNSARYAYWKTLEIPAKVPDFKDAIVHQKVLDAFKFEKAKPLAEKRAKELAELMKKGDADIAAALSGQTINGTPDSPAIAIREPRRFSWLHLPQNFGQFALQQPTQSTIDGIGQPGYQFLKTVFDDLGNGETGVTVNSSRTSYYAVRVHDRDASNAEGDGVATLADLQSQFSREQFSGYFPSAYDFIAGEIQQIIDGRWQADFRKRNGVVFENVGSEQSDEE